MSMPRDPDPGGQHRMRSAPVLPPMAPERAATPSGAAPVATVMAGAGRPGQPAQPIGGVLVSYTPVALAQRAAALRTVMVRRIVGLAIGIALLLLFVLSGSVQVGGMWFWVLVVSAIYSAGLTGWAIVQAVWTGNETGKVPLGPAFQIDNRGLVLSTTPLGERIDWPDIRSVRGHMKWFNPGPRLEFAWADGRTWSVPVVMLDVPPSGLDSALRAHSLGRFGLDLSGVDDLW